MTACGIWISPASKQHDAGRPVCGLTLRTSNLPNATQAEATSAWVFAMTAFDEPARGLRQECAQRVIALVCSEPRALAVGFERVAQESHNDQRSKGNTGAVGVITWTPTASA